MPSLRRSFALSALAFGAVAPAPLLAALSNSPAGPIVAASAQIEREQEFMLPGVAAMHDLVYLGQYNNGRNSGNIRIVAPSRGQNQLVGRLGYNNGIYFPTAVFVDAQRNLWVANIEAGLSYIVAFHQGATHPFRVLRDLGGAVLTSLYVRPDGDVIAAENGGSTGFAIWAPGARRPRHVVVPNIGVVEQLAADNNGNLYGIAWLPTYSSGIVIEQPKGKKRWEATPISAASAGGIAIDGAGHIVVSDGSSFRSYDPTTYALVADTPCRDPRLGGVPCANLAFTENGQLLWMGLGLVNGPPLAALGVTYPRGTVVDPIAQRSGHGLPYCCNVAVAPALLPEYGAPTSARQLLSFPQPPAAVALRAKRSVAQLEQSGPARVEATYTSPGMRPLEYVADYYRNTVYIYGGPRDERIGRIHGLQSATGVAVDSAGNVYIADAAQGVIDEFAAGATRPSRVLVDSLEVPFGISPDGPNGDVAVADLCYGILGDCVGTGDVAIYHSGQTQAALRLAPRNFQAPFFVAYDAKGAIVADGLANLGNSASGIVGTFAPGTYAFTPSNITLTFPGGLQVAPNGDIAVIDQGNGSRTSASRLLVFAPGASAPKSSITVGRKGEDVIAFAFAARGTTVFAANYSAGLIPEFRYPGGDRVDMLEDLLGLPYGVAVSPAIQP